MKIQIQNLSCNYSVKRISQEDINTLLGFCKGNPLYYQHMKMQPTIENLTESMSEVPSGKTLDDKYFVGFWENDKLIAILDLIAGFPNEETAFIGWFMMNKACQGKGLGSEIIRVIMRELKKIGFQKARLGYIKGNLEAQNFWTKNGFMPTGSESEAENYIVVGMEREL